MSTAPAADKGKLDALLRVLAVVEDAVLVFTLSAMLLVAGGQILLRNVWETGMAWGDPLLRVMVLWLGMLGAMAASRADGHITIDVLSRLFVERGRQAVRALTDLFAASVCAIVAFEGGRLVAMELEAGTVAFASVPAWACGLAIPLGFGVMALRFAVSAARRLKARPRHGG